MEVRLKTTTGVAFALILIGIATPTLYARWLYTRTFVALELPVSLSPGHIRTADFSVNLSAWYQIGVDGDNLFLYRPDCGLGAVDPLLKTRSIVYRDGQAQDHFDGADRFLGHFYAKKGRRYRLDIQVLTDASCLNGGRPRIFAWTPSIGYELIFDQLLALSVVLVLAGLGILAFSAARRQRTAQVRLAIVENAGHDYYPSRRKMTLKARISQPPSFGLVYSIILGGILIPTFLIYLYAWGYDHRSIGIAVHLLKPSPLRATPEFRPAPLIVRIESSGLNAPPRLYLNSEAIAWDGLSFGLKAELKTRAVWVVYVEADADVNWADAANAMDIIRGTGANVVLQTTEAPASHSMRRHAQP
jgi:biopolymer transport protein ExbD